jgi:hypothetical protein
LGFSSQKVILGSAILSFVNLSSVAVFTFVVDRASRRFLFLVGGIAMMLCQVINTRDKTDVLQGKALTEPWELTELTY